MIRHLFGGMLVIWIVFGVSIAGAIGIGHGQPGEMIAISADEGVYYVDALSGRAHYLALHTPNIGHLPDGSLIYTTNSPIPVVRWLDVLSDKPAYQMIGGVGQVDFMSLYTDLSLRLSRVAVSRSNGTLLIAQVGRGNSMQLSLVNAYKNTRHTLPIPIFGSTLVSDYAWSDDGTEAALLTFHASDMPTNTHSFSRLYRLEESRDMLELLVENRRETILGFRWMPGTTQIVYVARNVAGADIEVRVIDTTTSTLLREVKGVPFGEIAWSPDGTQLIVVKRTHPDYAIYLVDALEGQSQHLLAGIHEFYSAYWLP